MPLEIPNFFPIQYSANWNHLSQQADSRVATRVTRDPFNGREKQVQYVGKRSFRPVTTRLGRTITVESELHKRWLRKQPFDDAFLIDENDEQQLNQIASPQSAHVMEQSNAWARLLDKVVIDAALGDAWIGDTGTEALAFPAGQKIAVNYVSSGSAANSNLTLDKVIKAIGLFGTNEVPDDEPKFLFVGQSQLDKIMLEARVTNRDFSPLEALHHGSVNGAKFMGCTWIRTGQLPVASNVRTCVLFSQRGIHFDASDKMVHVDRLAERNHAIQVRAKGMAGAARVEESRVVAIFCDETV